jgi:hypothetical protein
MPAAPPSVENPSAMPTPTVTPQPAAVVPELKPAPAASTAKPGVVSPPNQVNAVHPRKELGFKPIETPELPISAAKEAQLQALLAKYKANQIAPDEYQKQRAEIMAQP